MEKEFNLKMSESQLNALFSLLLERASGIEAANMLSSDKLADIFEANKRAVVRVRIGSGKDRDSATGFIISAKGYLLTAEHVVYDEERGCFYPDIRMSFEKGGRKYKLCPLYSCRSLDIALCEFAPDEVTESYSAIKLISHYSALRAGETCYMIGNSADNGLAPISGNVRQPKIANGDLQLEADINPGDSGAPVFNSNGECIGLAKCRMDKLSGVQISGIAYATPADKINQRLNDWFKEKDILM
ncbi:MAG: serine protease [Clostridia bacterium]|nr:serine protease [Clostridia bacterium]